MAFGGCADRLILYPTTHRIDPEGAARRAVPWDGGEVEIWTARSPGARRIGEPGAYVIEFTGNATRAEEIAAYSASRWGGRSVELWAVNYPGYGGSSGPARLASIGPAALAAFDALQRQAGGRPIIVAGNSLGTTAALHIAAKRAVAGVILQNPPPLRQMILREHGWWNAWLVAGPLAMSIPSDLDSVSNAKSAKAPAVFVLSGQDEIVPAKYQRMVVDAYVGEKRTIDLAEANHNSPIEGNAVRDLEAAFDWLLRTE